MTKTEALAGWRADSGARTKELLLALTGNPSERVAVPVDLLALLVVQAKRSSLWLDYEYGLKEKFDLANDAALSLCDERAHEVIENQAADYEAYLAEWTQASEQ